MTIYTDGLIINKGGNQALSQAIEMPWYKIYGDEIVFSIWLSIFVFIALLVYKKRQSIVSLCTVKLEEPVNRAGFFILVAGAASIAVSVGWHAFSGGYRDYMSLTFDLDQRAYYGWQWLGRVGLFAMIAGAWLAWAYQPTLGRILRWIRHGNTPK